MKFRKHKYLNIPLTSESSMTICIGILCDKAKKAVMISDKMITMPGLSQEFEHETPKVAKINNSCLAISAGDALIPNDLFDYVNKDLRGIASPKIKDIVEKLKSCYARLRKKYIEEEFLSSRGFTIDSFYKNMSELSPQIAIPIDSKIVDYDLGVDIVLGGKDDDGAHIYLILNPGIARCYNSMGYVATGSGMPHSLHSFITNNYHPDISFKEALFLAYEAKRLAERAPGVGRRTDIWVIDENGIKEISPIVLKELDEIYEDKMKSQKDTHELIKEKIENLSV